MSIERSIKHFEEDRAQSARIAAYLLLASGTTSPRVGGIQECTIHMIDDATEIEDLCQAMEKMALDNEKWSFFRKDAVMLRDADVVLVVTSLRSTVDPADTNCNMCGKSTCSAFRNERKNAVDLDRAYPGPLCIFRAGNIAYAIDAIVSSARNLGIDYGVYWSAGAAAIEMNLLPKNTGLAVAIGISVTEKSPFRDIPKKYDIINESTMNERIVKRLWPMFRGIYS